MNLKKTARKIGFTPTELKSVLFLLTALLIGLFLKWNENDRRKIAKFDYSEQDSLFAEYDSAALISNKTPQKKVAVKKETFDFSENKSNLNIKFVNRQICVNVNTANADELKTLPGIGSKTAERIIEYRKENGNFKSKEELLNVKGIGKKKLEKIKSLIEIN